MDLLLLLLCSVKPWSRSTKCCTYTLAAPWPSTAASCCVEPHAARGTSTEHTSKMGVGYSIWTHTDPQSQTELYRNTNCGKCRISEKSNNLLKPQSQVARDKFYTILWRPRGDNHMILHWAETQPSVYQPLWLWLCGWFIDGRRKTSVSKAKYISVPEI